MPVCHIHLFLCFLSVAKDAFWVLVQICEKYLPGYYSAGLVRSHTASIIAQLNPCCTG